MAERKRKIQDRKREKRESVQVSKDMMSNKNRKLMKVIEHSVGLKKA